MKLTARCAACGKLLGSVDDDGWIWNCGTPARLVNRRRLIATVETEYDAATFASSPDDFRTRVVKRYDATEYNVWEYPYVCGDACMTSLGSEWAPPPPSDAEPAFRVMPEGRVLS